VCLEKFFGSSNFRVISFCYDLDFMIRNLIDIIPQGQSPVAALEKAGIVEL